MMRTRRRHWLVSMLAALLALTAACGGGEDDDGGASADVEAEADIDGADAEADVEADVDAGSDAEAEDFECPVSLADVEEVYEPVQFKDVDLGPEDCTFVREDGIGSVSIGVSVGNTTATYAGLMAMMPEAEEIDGVGDKAAYSSARTKLVAQIDNKVLVVQVAAMLGVGGAEDASSDELDENVEKATIELATRAAAEM